MENINNNEEIIEDLKEEVEEANQEDVEESATSEEVAEDGYQRILEIIHD